MIVTLLIHKIELFVGSSQGGGRAAKLTSTQTPGALGAFDESEEKSIVRPVAVPPNPRHSGTQSPRAAVGGAKPTVTAGSVHSLEDPKTGMLPRPAPPVGVTTGIPASPRTSHVKAEATMRPVERASGISPGHAKKATFGTAVQVRTMAHSLFFFKQYDLSSMRIFRLFIANGGCLSISLASAAAEDQCNTRNYRKKNPESRTRRRPIDSEAKRFQFCGEQSPRQGAEHSGRARVPTISDADASSH